MMTYAEKFTGGNSEIFNAWLIPIVNEVKETELPIILIFETAFEPSLTIINHTTTEMKLIN